MLAECCHCSSSPIDQTSKSEDWELEMCDRSSRSSYGWLVSNTAGDCLQRQIAKSNLLFGSLVTSRKKWLVTTRSLQSLKTFLTLKLSQYCKSGSTFSSSEPVAARSDCSRLGIWVGNTLCLCSPQRQSDPQKLCWCTAPRAWPLILQSKTSIAFWNSLQRDCQMTGRGSNLDSNLNSAAWPIICNGFIASEIRA